MAQSLDLSLTEPIEERVQNVRRTMVMKWGRRRGGPTSHEELASLAVLNILEDRAMQAIEAETEGEAGSHPFVEGAKSLLREHCGDGVCLKEIARQLYVNPAYLGRLFKTHVNMTFNDYLVQIRMEKAKELLVTTDKRIYEIAREVGYRQLDWFYKKFRGYAGCSAKEYKWRQMKSH